MKTFKLLMYLLLFTIFTSCATYQPCPVYSKVDKQDINQNQNEMIITQQFVEPSYIQQPGDILVFQNGNKGELIRISKLPSHAKKNKLELYYHIKTKYNNICVTSANHITYIERNILGKCSLPVTQDLIQQLKLGDKVLLKKLKDNPYKLDYRTGIVTPFVRQLFGTEITVSTNIQTSSWHNKYGIVDEHHNVWYPREIKRITFIKSQKAYATAKTG